jgi:manganese/zinc/iron transport system substrate-binding protein
MDASLWADSTGAIVDVLSRLDPAGASLYRERGAQTQQEMLSLDEAIRANLMRLPPERRYLVTSHDAFHYFARRYLADLDEADWSDRVRAPEGLAPDGQLGPSDLQEIVDYVRLHDLKVIFPESNVSPDSVRKIAEIAPVEVCPETLYGDATGRGGYFEMMRHNGDVLMRYLQ